MEGFLRPEQRVLADNTVLPNENIISPAPNQFTHELLQAEPYFFNRTEPNARPDGVLQAGTRVVLLVYDGGATCRIVDDQGLYVEVEYSSLHKLDDRLDRPEHQSQTTQ